MSSRYPPVKRFQTPGPDKYEVPTTLGPKVPNKYANAAYSMYVFVLMFLRVDKI